MRSPEPGSQERVIHAMRAVATAETSAALGAELDQYRAAWRQTLDTVKQTLSELEASVLKQPVDPSTAVSRLVERLVAVATAAADAAAQQIRTEARAEIGQLQGVLDQSRADLQKTRDELKAAVESLHGERTPRTRAEAAAQDAEQQLKALGAELDTSRAEIARLQKQIAAERAERAALVSAIRSAVGANDAPRVESLAPAVVESREPAAPEPAAPEPAPPEPLQAASEPSNGDTPDADPTQVAYARDLLGKVETMYKADVAARRSASDLVDRLTASLRRARVQFARRIGATDLNEAVVFEQQLAEILNTSEESAFSRHLGIAAYASLSKSASQTDAQAGTSR